MGERFFTLNLECEFQGSAAPLVLLGYCDELGDKEGRCYCRGGQKPNFNVWPLQPKERQPIGYLDSLLRGQPSLSSP